METQLATLVNLAANYLATGKDDARRWGSAHVSIVPYQAFETAEGGEVVVGAGTERQWKALCEILKAPELFEDPRYATNAKRVEHRGSLLPKLATIFRQHPRSHWENVFNAILSDTAVDGEMSTPPPSVPFGPVRTIGEAFEDEQAWHRGMRVRVEHAHPHIDSVELVGPAVKLSRTPCVVRTAPPLCGQHTHLVLKEILGYSDSEVEHLLAHGVVEATPFVPSDGTLP